jgi:hypothetical protein
MWRMSACATPRPSRGLRGVVGEGMATLATSPRASAGKHKTDPNNNAQQRKHTHNSALTENTHVRDVLYEVAIFPRLGQIQWRSVECNVSTTRTTVFQSKDLFMRNARLLLVYFVQTDLSRISRTTECRALIHGSPRSHAKSFSSHNPI